MVFVREYKCGREVIYRHVRATVNSALGQFDRYPVDIFVLSDHSMGLTGLFEIDDCRGRDWKCLEPTNFSFFRGVNDTRH